VKTTEKLLLTYRETSEILGISMRSLTRAVKHGELIPVQAPGTRGRSGRRFLARDIANQIAHLGEEAKKIAHPSLQNHKGKMNGQLQRRSVKEVVDAVIERSGNGNRSN